MTDNRTISPHQGEKRNRIDDPEEPDRCVSRRTGAPVAEDVTATKASIREIILTDLWSPKGGNRKQAIIQLAVAMTGNDDAKHAEIQKQFYQVGGHLAVTKAMTRHPDCNIVQENGIKILVNASYKSEDLKSAIADVGGIDMILAAMIRFPLHEGITILGLQGLSNLCLHASNSEALVIKHNGVPVIVERLGSFKDDHRVVLWACRVIHKLSGVETLRKTLFEAKTLSALSAAAEGPHTSPEVKRAVGQSIAALAEYLKNDE